MRRILHARLLASALAASALPFVASAIPAQAQMDGDVSFDSFHDQLAQYGYWVYSDRWGLVWQPADVSDDFRPYYSRGRWVYTDDYGWLWSSDYAWGDIAFHYGRWVNDPDNGWMWIPGYTWSPGWVVWRSNGQYIGWMPAPPDRAFLGGEGDVRLGLSFGMGGGAVSFGWRNDPYYGYRGWYGPGFDQRSFAANWTFVGTGQLADRDYASVAVSNPGLVVNIISQTRNVTNYTVVNNYVVNRSINIHVVERAAGHPIQVTAARSVIRQPNLIMHANAGQRFQMEQRAIAPRGTGLANSAPPPSALVVNKLSAKAPPPRNGQTASHVFTRTTVAAPEAQSHFHGAPAHGAPPEAGPAGMKGPAGAPGGMTGPGGETPPAPETRHREPGQPAGASGGMTGPAAETTPGTEPRHHAPVPPAGGPGTMSGPAATPAPGGEPPAAPEPRHHHPVPPAGGPDTMGGPGAAPPPGGEGAPPPEVRHRAPPPQAAPAAPPPAPGTPPPEKKKKPRPDEPPPPQ